MIPEGNLFKIKCEGPDKFFKYRNYWNEGTRMLSSQASIPSPAKFVIFVVMHLK